MPDPSGLSKLEYLVTLMDRPGSEHKKKGMNSREANYRTDPSRIVSFNFEAHVSAL